MSEAKKPRKGTRKGKGNIKRETKAEMVALLPEMGSQAAVAEAFGVDRSVVTRAVADPEVSRLARVKKELIADKFGQLVDKLLDRHLEIANTATLDDKSSTLLGIAADKHRLYSEEPTQITESRGDAAMRDSAKEIFGEILTAVGGDESKARELMKEWAPTLSKWVN